MRIAKKYQNINSFADFLGAFFVCNTYQKIELPSCLKKDIPEDLKCESLIFYNDGYFPKNILCETSDDFFGIGILFDEADVKILNNYYNEFKEKIKYKNARLTEFLSEMRDNFKIIDLNIKRNLADKITLLAREYKNLIIENFSVRTFPRNENPLKKLFYKYQKFVVDQLDADFTVNGNNLYIKENKKTKIKKTIPILQIDKDTGKIIEEFESIDKCAEKLKINKNGITNCCKGKQKTSGGYIFKYKK